MTDIHRPTATDVANWMLVQLNDLQYLQQSVAVFGIAEKFSGAFTYTNDNGNLAISPEVLRDFKRLTGETVVWDSGERAWRLRQESDIPGQRKA